MFDFVEAFDEEGGEILEVSTDGLLGLDELIFRGITFKIEVEEGVIFAVNFNLHFCGIGLVSLDVGKRYVGEDSDEDIFCPTEMIDIAIIIDILQIDWESVFVEDAIASIYVRAVIRRLGS